MPNGAGNGRSVALVAEGLELRFGGVAALADVSLGHPRWDDLRRDRPQRGRENSLLNVVSRTVSAASRAGDLRGATPPSSHLTGSPRSASPAPSRTSPASAASLCSRACCSVATSTCAPTRSGRALLRPSPGARRSSIAGWSRRSSTSWRSSRSAASRLGRCRTASRSGSSWGGRWRWTQGAPARRADGGMNVERGGYGPIHS